MSIHDLEFQQGIVRQPLTSAECSRLLAELPEWHIEHDPCDTLVAAFAFRDFALALQFANGLGELADRYNHHPELIVSYGRVVVKWWTHTANGITGNDFVLARETRAIASES